MKVYVILSKNEIMMNFFVSVKWAFCKNDYMWNPSSCHCKCNKACKIEEDLDIKDCSCRNVYLIN